MSDTYWLCAAGVTLRAQVDRRWPKRDKGADGWIGDASHAARASDHNPCWTCAGAAYGVVRAIDIDTNLDPADPKAAQRLADQLVALGRAQTHSRLSYVIFNRKIASGSFASEFWTWRPYDGVDPHTGHIHVSFGPMGDFKGGDFGLAVFTEPQQRRLRSRISRLTALIKPLVSRRRRARRNLDELVK